MRIIAGSLGGRQFDSPKSHKTHPMSEKARGALFNTLGDITGLTVLDAFAGSGALGLEAVSRGAINVLAIENDISAQKIVTKNISTLNLSNKVKLIKAGANAWLNTSETSFDLVLLDPPYDDLQPNLLKKLATRAKTGGLVVLSLPPNTEFNLEDNYELLANKNYGDADLIFYRKVSG